MTRHETLFRYRGRSMWPCFQEGDLLEVSPSSPDQLRLGDCLMFRSREGQLVVHRLVSKDRQGLVTRGDATAVPDPCAVTAEDLVGRVSHRQRLNRRVPVIGGRRGLLQALIYRYAGRIDPQRNSRGGSVARGIRRLSTAFFRLFWCWGKVERMQLATTRQVVIWRLGGRVVGQLDADQGEWRIRWPWRVFLGDELVR